MSTIPRRRRTTSSPARAGRSSSRCGRASDGGWSATSAPRLRRAPASSAAAEAEAHYLRMCAAARHEHRPSCAPAGRRSRARPRPGSRAPRGTACAEASCASARCCWTAPACRATRPRRWTGSPRAARQGSPEAMNMVGPLLRERLGRAGGPGARPRTGTARRPKPATTGASTTTPTCCSTAAASPATQAQAVAWYRRAAEQGHARAMNLLGALLRRGLGRAARPGAAPTTGIAAPPRAAISAPSSTTRPCWPRGRMDEALDWFEKACRGATPESLRGHDRRAGRASGDPRLSELGRRTGEAVVR